MTITPDLFINVVNLFMPEETSATPHVRAYVVGYKMALEHNSTQMPHCNAHKMVMQYYSSPYECCLDCPYALHNKCLVDLNRYLR